MNKILYIFRGLPGSGKSTAARDLARGVGNEKNLPHFEADMYFMENGEYKFDPSKLHLAHAWCQDQVRKAMAAGEDVVVSNTFTTFKELKPYFAMVFEEFLDYRIHVVEMTGSYGNVHDVPVEAIERMKTRWVSNDELKQLIGFKNECNFLTFESR